MHPVGSCLAFSRDQKFKFETKFQFEGVFINTGTLERRNQDIWLFLKEPVPGLRANSSQLLGKPVKEYV